MKNRCAGKKVSSSRLASGRRRRWKKCAIEANVLVTDSSSRLSLKTCGSSGTAAELLLLLLERRAKLSRRLRGSDRSREERRANSAVSTGVDSVVSTRSSKNDTRTERIVPIVGLRSLPFRKPFGMHAKGIACCLVWSVFLTCHVLSQTSTPVVGGTTDDVLVFTVASNETDGFKRYLRSAEVYGLRDRIKILGLGETWKGGNVQITQGGGYKINLFKQALKEYKNDKDRLIIFTDSYDVIFLANLADIVEKFQEIGARILFSAEETCWPHRNLAAKYPPVTRGKRFLNSGGFIGYASDIYSILDIESIKDTDDDQLYYTNVYLDEFLREKHKIKLDHKSEIFQNLYAAVADVELRFKGQEAYLQNIVYNTLPLMLHGNGLSKLVLNSLGNYLARAWSPEKGCLSCWDDTIELDLNKPETYPVIVIALFIEHPTPFLEEFLDRIYQQAYPKSKLHLFIYNNVEYHRTIVETFVKKIEGKYKSIKQILPSDSVNEIFARNLAMNYCLSKECSGYFYVDSIAHLDNEYTLKLLVEQQRGIIAPLLVRPYKAWSNFWGAITDDGFYARSFDYMEIVKNERR